MRPLRNFVPLQLRSWSRQLTRTDFRSWKRREIARLKALPRYEATSSTLIGKSLDIVDAASFLFMYGEIFDQQIYAFAANSPQPYIIDGGANIGLSTLYFKQLYPQSRIVAFEPDDKLFGVLQANLASHRHEDVQVLCRALWSSETILSFVAEGADAGRVARADDRTNTSVQTVSLRQYLQQPVDFLKLDIEGAETEVLRNCADLLCNVEFLFVEYHSFAQETQTLAAILNILSDAGYRIHIHPPVTSPQPFLRRDVHLGMDMQLNIFAFRS